MSERLCERGQAHYGSPDKHPQVRLDIIAAAGRLGVPFTSGILIGIGETRLERVASLLVLRDLHAQYGHLQEIIVQNFRAKPATRMAAQIEPDLDDLMWTVGVARLVFGPRMNIQVPPNLSSNSFGTLLKSGINDWGGVSPVTPDHVNPEAPWPELELLERITADAGFNLVQRLAIYPAYIAEPEGWLHQSMRTSVLHLADAEGFAREDGWATGMLEHVPVTYSAPKRSEITVDQAIARAEQGIRLSEHEVVRLFSVRGADVDHVCAAADRLRARASGDVVRYVVNRNINYTNVCVYKCGFCAFSKGKTSEQLRGRPYDLSDEEIQRRVQEAWDRGATEVCMQGGINPHYTGETYLSILRTAKQQVRGHACPCLLAARSAAGRIDARDRRPRLSGTASRRRSRLAAGNRGGNPRRRSARHHLPRQADAPQNGWRWSRPRMMSACARPRPSCSVMSSGRYIGRVICCRIRDLQERTGGFTEFVPLPFVHMEAPLVSPRPDPQGSDLARSRC